MILSIFYKEWIKTRRMVWFCLIASLGFLLYTQMRLSRVVELQGAAHVWLIILSKDVTFIETLRFVPMAIGILLGLAQYVPEMQHKRLKLTLHLPIHYNRIIMLMSAYGLACLLAIFLIHYAWLWIYLHQLFATPITKHILLTSLPWYIGGIAGYAFTVWMCVEPTWKYRVIHFLFAAISLRLLYISPYPCAYNRVLGILILVSVFSIGYIILSVSRFKRGEQDY